MLAFHLFVLARILVCLPQASSFCVRHGTLLIFNGNHLESQSLSGRQRQQLFVLVLRICQNLLFSKFHCLPHQARAAKVAATATAATTTTTEVRVAAVWNSWILPAFFDFSVDLSRRPPGEFKMLPI
jgi:hypothetical protein